MQAEPQATNEEVNNSVHITSAAWMSILWRVTERPVMSLGAARGVLAGLMVGAAHAGMRVQGVDSATSTASGHCQNYATTKVADYKYPVLIASWESPMIVS